MRKYIRHPANIPLEFHIESLQSQQIQQLRNISLGGLSFVSPTPIEKNSALQIRIPSVDPPFFATGIVVWCRKEHKKYSIGVKFIDEQTAFRIRMVEQICYIKGYQKYVQEQEGRDISDEDAASEWISKYAKYFPTLQSS